MNPIMPPGTIEVVFTDIAGIVATMTGLFAGPMLYLASAIIGMALVWQGIAILAGYRLPLPSLAGFVLAGAASLALLGNWPQWVGMMRAVPHGVLGAIMPGYNGPTLLFEAAIETYRRMELARVAFDWTAPLQSAAAMVGLELLPLITLIFMCVPGILAIIAELEFLVVAAFSPLTLPFLPLPQTSGIAWGTFRALLLGMMRMAVVGSVNFMVTTAATRRIVIAGADETMTAHDVAIALLAVLSIGLFAFRSYGLASQIVGGFGNIGGEIFGGATRAVSGSIQSGAIKSGAAGAAGAISAGASAAGRALTGGGASSGGGGGSVPRSSANPFASGGR